MRTLIWDFLIVAGLLAIAVGMGWAWTPLGFITAGAELLGLGVLGLLAHGKVKEDQK